MLWASYRDSFTVTYFVFAEPGVRRDGLQADRRRFRIFGRNCKNETGRTEKRIVASFKCF
jgi:hypothetical protein